jgi:hypothetical protein
MSNDFYLNDAIGWFVGYFLLGLGLSMILVAVHGGWVPVLIMVTGATLAGLGLHILKQSREGRNV